MIVPAPGDPEADSGVGPERGSLFAYDPADPPTPCDPDPDPDPTVEDLLVEYLDAANEKGRLKALQQKLDRRAFPAFIKSVERQCCLPTNGRVFTRDEADQLIDMARQASPMTKPGNCSRW